MKTRLSLIALLALTVVALVSFRGISMQEEKDWTKCLEAYKTEWGQACSGCIYSPDIFKVYLKNTCTEKIDVMVAVQEKDKKWKCYHQEALAPQDTFVAFACKGNGKYLKWVRKSGDMEIVLPTCPDINTQYK